VGPPVDRLYQILHEGLHENILFIKFEDLCIDPNKEMSRIYDYLELDYFQHNFNNIEQYTHEDDKIYGVFGDHIIRNKLEPVIEDYEEILGETGCKLITDSYAWFYDVFEYKV